jgi:hypothetical protein
MRLGGRVPRGARSVWIDIPQMTRDLFENSIMYLSGPPGMAALWSRIGRKRTLREQGKINAIGTSRSWIWFFLIVVVVIAH